MNAERSLYNDVSYDLARQLTLRYSSSFGLASRLFDRSVQKHIYAIYGMVRLADEIVDTYGGPDTPMLLSSFYSDVKTGLETGYSTNPIIQAFITSAREYAIALDLIEPFFDSMKTDLTATRFSQAEYEQYIYGSAEVIGLMCLKVFCNHDDALYERLSPGARILGSAYQKVNFLRDFGADYTERGRIYFPGVTYETWNDEQKDAIVSTITDEFMSAKESIKQLPRSARRSVAVSYAYYTTLLERLTAMSAEQIRTSRAHVPTSTKLFLLLTGARLA